MIDSLDIPKSFDGFLDQYSFYDRKEVYTDYKELVEVFRVRQWLESNGLLNEQPTLDNWVPVSERLPQASKHILFSVKGKSYASYGFYNDGIWTDINGAWYTDKEVNAWAPLPEPYKESD